MTAQEFWMRFCKNIYKDPALCERWNDTAAFTEAILEKLETVIEEDGCRIEREYFRVDLISYRSHVKANEALQGGLKRYAWDLVTAVEHENDRRLWMDEVVKLAHIACELRVVIGYLPLHDTHAHEEYLEKIAEELYGIKAWQATKDCGEFMILIGDCKLAHDEEERRCVYTPYVFQDGRFQRPSWL
jgi:hypothetical protein